MPSLWGGSPVKRGFPGWFPLYLLFSEKRPRSDQIENSYKGKQPGAHRRYPHAPACKGLPFQGLLKRPAYFHVPVDPFYKGSACSKDESTVHRVYHYAIPF
jgi:hypothetical protein